MAKNVPNPASNPKQGLPKWLWTLVALAGLAFAAGLVAPYFVPWDKLKDQAAAAATKSLGRKLSIGKVEVGLFSGVHVKDISLANAAGFSREPLFSNADAKVSFSLLGLLTGKVVLSSITFDRPQLLLETDAQGRSNLEGLAASTRPTKPASLRAGSSATPDQGKETALPVLIASLEIQDGDLVLKDRQKGTTTAVHGLNVKLLGISLAAAGNSRLEASLVAEVEGKKIPLTVHSDFHLDLPGQELDILDFKATLPAVVASLTGTLKDFDRPHVELAAGVDVDVALLPELLPPSTLKGLPGDLKTAGAVKLGLSVSGPTKAPKDMAMKGSLSFKDVSVEVGGYPALGSMNGTLNVDKAGAALKELAFKLGGDPATLALDAHWGDLANLSNGASKLKAQVSIKLSSPKLNLDPLLGAGQQQDAQAPAPAQAQAGTTGSGLQDLRASVPKGLDLRLDVDADSVVVRGMKTGKLAERLVLKAQKAATSTQWDLYQGHFSEKTVLDFSQLGPVFKTSMQMQGMRFEQLVDDMAAAPKASPVLGQLKGKVSGVLSFKADAKGRGVQDPALSQNLQATASFSLKDGVIRKTDAQEALAAAIPDPATQATLRNDIKFSNAIGNLVVAGTKTTLKNFQLGSGSDWRGGVLYLQASGSQVKDGALDYRVIPHFNPAQVQVAGDLGRALQDDHGWPTFDYVAYGGPTAAQAKADFSAGIQKAATKAVTNKVQDLIQNQAGNALKGLFGQ
jgi:uncharacterized protein involved in outer membrane biogenesis